ncbi:hypothetical protein [Curtobacterium pusillum]|uniref:hypothetical protein n=1 Tax=Curtobacterium pusillum TaxID=69373 RepID=UPI00119FAE95|nr:hypothetical protein [Curtobacterium pusillum]
MTRRRERRSNRATAVEAARAALGVAHLVRAARTSGSTGRDEDGTVWFHRVLGVRQLAQAGLLARNGSPTAHTLATLVDATHAVSMVPLAVVDRRRRRFAVGQLLVAVGLAVAEALLVGPGGRRRGR